METAWWKTNIQNQSVDQLMQTREIIDAASCLQSGELVAFPTETVYGLGADATSKEAVKKIFVAKGRPSDNPLIVHIGEISQLEKWVQAIPPLAIPLMEAFWPGPLTLVFYHAGNIAENVTGGLPTIGVRIPDHSVAQALLQVVDLPIAAPSANRSGKPSPTQAQHVWKDLVGKISVLLDGGHTGMGIESTVVDVTRDVPYVLRPGGIPLEELRKVVGEVQLGEDFSEIPQSPGMKYRHYSPDAPIWIVDGEEGKIIQEIQKHVNVAQQQGMKVGVLTTHEHKEYFHADVVLPCGYQNDAKSVAHGLYAVLRQFDHQQVDMILAEAFPREGLFSSIMNRLVKAADGNVIYAD